MQKYREVSPMEPCRTRLSIKLNIKKSKFTASDIEIISDLEELSYFTKRVQVMRVIESQLPMKRKRKVNKGHSLEDDAVNALSSLIGLSRDKNRNLNEKQNFKGTNFGEITCIEEGDCKNEISYAQNDEYGSARSDAKIQLEMSWIAQLLEVNT